MSVESLAFVRSSLVNVTQCNSTVGSFVTGSGVEPRLQLNSVTSNSRF